MSQITLQPTLPSQLLTQNGAGASLARLKIGDQLHATVVSQQNGKAELRLPEGTVSARTQVPLQTGQQLRLTVAQLQPQVTLSLSRPPLPTADAMSQKLLPSQQPLQQALQKLSQLLQGSTGGKVGQEAIQRLLLQLPTLVQLFDPKVIKQQVINSATSMENRLLNGRSAPPGGDLKMLLLQAKVQLLQQPDHAKAVRQIESMIARIALNQLKSMQSQPQNSSQPQGDSPSKEPLQRSWSVEIPFMVDDHPNQVSLRFRHHQEPDHPEKERWHIELNLEPPELGTIEAHAIHHQQQLDIHFLSEKAETATLINEQIEQLSAALSMAGISPGTLFSRQRSVNDLPQRPDTPLYSSGFSIKV